MTLSRRSEYFCFPHPLWTILIPIALAFLVVARFSPHSFPVWLGPLGEFFRYMGTEQADITNAAFLITFGLHSTSPPIAIKMARSRGLSVSCTIKWALSSFIYASASLIRLRAYDGKKTD